MSASPKQTIRTRIAPSPTGLFHIGTARTALFNYLFAKHHKGTFIVRIEDTDKERSKKEFEIDILGGLKQLGIEWDEGPDSSGAYGPYRQSERTEIYKKYLDILLEKGSAYMCFCSTEELEAIKADQATRGEIPKYPGTCRTLSPEEAKKLQEAKKNFIYRFKMPVPAREVTFHDLIRGDITVNTETIEDLVIAKMTGEPLYNFAVVVDDYEMKITHVIRGEDHIPNTPKQLMIIEALGAPKPLYAHLPLILGLDRSKLSKRHGAVSVIDYLNDGFLPEAIVNFIALLGFSPKGDRELLSLDELVEEFSLERVQKAGAIFNIQKLEWFNNHYIREKDPDELTKLAVPYFKKAGLIEGRDTEFPKLKKIIELEQERVKKLSELPSMASFFFKKPEPYDPKLLVWKTKTLEDTRKRLEEIKKAVEGLSSDSFTPDDVHDTLDKLVKPEEGRGPVFLPFRVALSGREHSPPPSPTAAILGKEETIKRISNAISLLTTLRA